MSVEISESQFEKEVLQSDKAGAGLFSSAQLRQMRYLE